MKFLILAACIAFVCAAPATDNDEPIPILSSFSDSGPDGSYKYGFESGNGIQRSEIGTISSDESIDVKGSYRYMDPNGNPVEAEYSIINGVISGRYLYTDANGEEASVSYTTIDGKFVPSGNIIPEEITNLARNAEPYEESEFRKLKKTIN